MNGHGELLDLSRCEFFRHFRVRCCWKGDEDSDELSEAAVFFSFRIFGVGQGQKEAQARLQSFE